MEWAQDLLDQLSIIVNSISGMPLKDILIVTTFGIGAGALCMCLIGLLLNILDRLIEALKKPEDKIAWGPAVKDRISKLERLVDKYDKLTVEFSSKRKSIKDKHSNLKRRVKIIENDLGMNVPKNTVTSSTIKRSPDGKSSDNYIAPIGN